MNGLRWLVYRRCGCQVCLPWRPALATACWWVSLPCLWVVAVMWGSGLSSLPVLTRAGIVAVAAAVILTGWPLDAHDDGDDLEAIVQATRECGACSPQDHGPCRCTTACGNIRCTAGFPGRPDSADWDIRELTGQ